MAQGPRILKKQPLLLPMPDPSLPNRTLKQLRLEHAWHCADAAKEELSDQYESYARAVKNLPTQIRGNGLGQALAYLATEGLDKDGKPKKPEGYLYYHVESWLTDREEIEDTGEPGDTTIPKGSYVDRADGENDDASTKLIYRIARESSIRYRRGTSEALDYLAVLRFVAEAVEVGPFEPSEEVADEDGITSSSEPFSQAS